MDKQQVKTMRTFGYSIEELPNVKQVPRMDFKHPVDGHIMPNLPVDAYHLHRYLARGFIPINKSVIKEVAAPQSDLCCEECGKTFSKPIGLIGHRRTHKSKEKEDKI